MTQKVTHDPQAVRTYGLSWAGALAHGDKLASCAWTVPSGLTLMNQGVNTTDMVDAGRTYAAGTVAWVRLSGGTAGVDYDCVCHVVTQQGDEDERTLRVQVRER